MQSINHVCFETGLQSRKHPPEKAGFDKRPQTSAPNVCNTKAPYCYIRIPLTQAWGNIIIVRVWVVNLPGDESISQGSEKYRKILGISGK